MINLDVSIKMPNDQFRIPGGREVKVANVHGTGAD